MPGTERGNSEGHRLDILAPRARHELGVDRLGLVLLARRSAGERHAHHEPGVATELRQHDPTLLYTRLGPRAKHQGMDQCPSGVERTGIELDAAPCLRFCLFKLSAEGEYDGCLAVRHRAQRVGLDDAEQLRRGEVVLAANVAEVECRLKGPGINVGRIEFDGAGKCRLRPGLVELDNDGVEGERDLGGDQARIKLLRAGGGAAGAIPDVGGKDDPVQAHQDQRLGELGVGEGEVGVEGEGPLKAIGGAQQGQAPLLHERMPPEIQVVCLDVRGEGADELPLTADAKRHLQLPGNRRCDLVLDGEDIGKFPVIALRPEMIAVGDVDELRGDTDPSAGAPHASLEHGGDVELLADRPEVEVLALKGEC